MIEERTKGYVYGILAAFFWGVHPVISRSLADHIPGMIIATLRLYVASFFLFLLFLFYKRKEPISISHPWWFLSTVIFGLGLNFVFFHVGLEYTTAANAMLLENTAPFFVLIILLIFFREKISAREIMGVLLGIVGIGFITFHDGFFSLNIGNILEIIAGFTWALFILGSSKIFAQEPTLGKRVSIEAGVSFGWHQWIGMDGIAISIETFGESAPQADIAAEFGFTVDAILNKLRK